MQAGGIVVARNLGEARSVIETLELVNWVPISPRHIPKNIKSANNVLVVDDFIVPDNVLRSIKVMTGTETVCMASVELL